MTPVTALSVLGEPCLRFPTVAGLPANFARRIVSFCIRTTRCDPEEDFFFSQPECRAVPAAVPVAAPGEAGPAQSNSTCIPLLIGPPVAQALVVSAFFHEPSACVLLVLRSINKLGLTHY